MAARVSGGRAANTCTSSAARTQSISKGRSSTSSYTRSAPSDRSQARIKGHPHSYRIAVSGQAQAGKKLLLSVSGQTSADLVGAIARFDHRNYSFFEDNSALIRTVQFPQNLSTSSRLYRTWYPAWTERKQKCHFWFTREFTAQNTCYCHNVRLKPLRRSDAGAEWKDSMYH